VGAQRVALVAVGGGSPIDAAKGIAIAAVNPQRGRELDYRSQFAVPALPIVAVPTTAGTGAETNAFGVVTDPLTHRKFYVGHASSMPAAAIADPALITGLPPAVTAATGMDALTHALESYLSLTPNPWSDGIDLQVIRLIAANLPRACADGGNLAARFQMLLAAHMAGVAMANTGLGICHAIGHALGGRWNIAHGVTLSMILPDVLRYNLPVRTERMADVAFALGVGDTGAGAARNAEAAIDAVAALRETVGITQRLTDFGITETDYPQIAADALDDEVLANTPRQPSAEDIAAILGAPLPGDRMKEHRCRAGHRDQPAVADPPCEQPLRAPRRPTERWPGDHPPTRRVGGQSVETQIGGWRSLGAVQHGRRAYGYRPADG
jgi:alcohol dehydrogenase